jgi:hypothetical protein
MKWRIIPLVNGVLDRVIEDRRSGIQATIRFRDTSELIITLATIMDAAEGMEVARGKNYGPCGQSRWNPREFMKLFPERF